MLHFPFIQRINNFFAQTENLIMTEILKFECKKV